MTKIPNPDEAVTNLKNAETSLHGLQKQHADLIQNRDVLREEAAQIAHAALTEGGSARKRLDVVNAEELAIDQRVANLAAAVRTAQRIFAQAQNAVEIANKASRAEEAIALADQYEALGETAHQAFVTAFDALREAKVCADRLRWIGGAYLEASHINASVDRAIATYQVGTRNPQLIRGLPRPGQRLGINEYFRAQAARMRTIARKYLEGEENAA